MINYINIKQKLEFMKLKEALKKLNDDVAFKQYLKDSPKTFLSHFFMMKGEQKQDWQIGYYNPDTNLVSTYLVTSKEITTETPQEPFKKPGDKVLGLDFDKVKLDYDEAMEIANKCLKEKYSKALVSKTMIILQNIREIGNVWNITFITLSLDTINIRINSDDGNVISHEKQSLIEKMPGLKK